MKVTILDKISFTNGDLNLGCFDSLGNVEYYDILPKNEVAKAVKDSQIVVCNKTVFDKELIDDINGMPASHTSDIIKLYKRDCEKEILENYIRPLIKYSRNDDAFCVHDDIIALEMVCPILIEKS